MWVARRESRQAQQVCDVESHHIDLSLLDDFFIELHLTSIVNRKYMLGRFSSKSASVIEMVGYV